MALHMDKSWWRTTLAIGIMPFAALGVTGCDNSEQAEDEVGVEEEAGGVEEEGSGEEEGSAEEEMAEEEMAEEEEGEEEAG